MADFLLELLSEEIPARMQARARADLERLFVEAIGESGLKAEEITVWSTPRRLALIARGLPEKTEAVREERKGPKADAPDQAIEGFLRSTGLKRKDLETREVKGKDTLFAVIDTPGRKAVDVLGKAIPKIVRGFPWPKSMRWGEASGTTESLRWVRPLQGIVTIFGDELVRCEVDGIVSGKETVGHRFHSEGRIAIDGAADYADKLRDAHVIVDQKERETLIRSRANELAAEAGLERVQDPALVEENAGLTEWPVPLLGSFDPLFLEVAPEAIMLAMRSHQKYFACKGKDGALSPHFICVANLEAGDGGAGVVAGNEKVLAARLSDARFFWEQDQKISLEEHAKKLGEIVFHEKLGTMADKVERVAKLARWLAEEGIVDAEPDQAETAARLAKADLVTGMVGEFADLQGLVGGRYAEAQGHGEDISRAIRNHYKPVGQDDDVPSMPVTLAVSLADKLDTLFAFFQIDEKPTGSKDPFALRRSALGILRMMCLNRLKARLRATAGEWQSIAGQARDETEAWVNDVLLFMHDRLTVQLRDERVRHDFVEASSHWQGARDDDLFRVVKRAQALHDFVETYDGANLLAGYKRAANILKKEEWEPVEGEYEPEPEEALLRRALETAEPEAEAAIEAEDFEGAMAALAKLREPIDAFFEKVTVNDDDPVKRASRLQMLETMRNAVHRVADFSKIEG